MKRIFAFISALFVCCSPCFAWSAESFIGNDYSDIQVDDSFYYSVEPVSFAMPRMFSMRSTSDNSLYSVDFTSYSSFSWLFPDDPLANLVGSYSFYVPSVGSYPLVSYFGSAPKPSSVSLSTTSNYYLFSSNSQTLTYSFDDDEYNSFDSWDYISLNGFEIDYDIPVPSNSYGVSFSPYLSGVVQAYSRNGYTPVYPVAWQLFINGEQMLSFTTSSLNSFYSKESTFTFTEPIESVVLRASFYKDQITTGLPSNSSMSGSFTIRLGGYIDTESSCIFGFLDEFGGLAANNNQAQNDINHHNALESEWTGSMTSNFDALSISDFEYPSGLISGFGLISGIFNDLWNGMGEYKIAYVFPLTLGVVLVVIGRMGRTKGGQGSGITNRGDSDA